MNSSIHFGSTFYVSAERTAGNNPHELEPQIRSIIPEPDFRQRFVGGFAPLSTEEKFVFSVPDERDQDVKAILESAGYAYKRTGHFMEGSGCMLTGKREALFYALPSKLDVTV